MTGWRDRAAGGATAPRVALLTALLAWLAVAVWLYGGLFMDDAWIGLRAVANLLAGRGLVFNPGERVEGVTNTGWLLLLAPAARLSSPPFAAKLLGVTCLGLALFFLYRAALPLARRLGPAWPPFTVLPLGLVLLAAANADLVSFSLLGMETGALAAVLTAMLWIATRERGWAALPFLGAFAFLLHPEAVLVYPAAAALALADRVPGSRRLLRGQVIHAALLGGITLARWRYYRALLPNTWGAKPPTARAALGTLLGFLDGSAVNLAFPFAGLFALSLLVLGYLALRRTAPLAAAAAGGIVGTGLLFALYARPDWTELGRYFAPYVPAALLLAGVGALDVERAVLTRGRHGGALRLWSLALAGVALVALLLGGAFAVNWADLSRWTAPAALALAWGVALEAEYAGDFRGIRGLGEGRFRRGLAPLAVAACVAFYGATATVARTTEGERLAYPGYILTSATLIPPALWMQAHLPPGTVIASRRIGALAYFSGHPVFDYSFGLTEPEVARLIHRRGGPFDDPNDPALAALWQRRAPAYLLEEADLVNRLGGLGAMTSGGRGELHVHGLVYRVIRRFPIARGVEWVLAGRATSASAVPGPRR
ncbi:MAG: arabinofuranosyltransferase [Acidobacteriota bacterium]|nr:arabinofuranosyltransferase [Acidobacteriota bacterium]